MGNREENYHSTSIRVSGLLLKAASSPQILSELEICIPGTTVILAAEIIHTQDHRLFTCKNEDDCISTSQKEV